MRFKARIEQAGKTATGIEVVTIDMTLDEAPRVVEVPEDFAELLRQNPVARKAFDALAYTHKKEHVRAIGDAKTDATRQRRMAKAVEKLSQISPE